MKSKVSSLQLGAAGSGQHGLKLSCYQPGVSESGSITPCTTTATNWSCGEQQQCVGLFCYQLVTTRNGQYYWLTHWTEAALSLEPMTTGLNCQDKTSSTSFLLSTLHALKVAGITHIVCIRHDLEASFIRPNFPSEFKYLVLNVADSERENIIQYFPEVFKFIATCLNKGGKVLVHGNAGISRSAAFVIAFVMEMYGTSYSDAAVCVQSRRFCANPNFNFVNQLQEYEPIYRARHTVHSSQPQILEWNARGSQKRKLVVNEDDRGQEERLSTSGDVNMVL